MATSSAAESAYLTEQRLGRLATAGADGRPHGRAEALATGGRELMDGFADEMIRIHADRVVSYGLDGD